MGDLSTIGLVFPVGVVLGYFLGRAVGDWFGAPQRGALVGGAFGLVAAFYNVFKVSRRMQRDWEREDTTRN